MVARVSEAEGLDLLTIDEARARPDWLKWDEVISKKLASLEACHRLTGSPSALLGILRGGVMVLEGAGILARGTGFCT